MTRTKQEIIDEIYALLGGPPPRVSTGSTEPKQVFLDTIEKLSLQISPTLSKPELGKAIAQAAGIVWTPECDSTDSPSGGGSTVTAAGLHRLLQSAQVLLGRRPTPPAGGPPQVGTPYTRTATPAVPPPGPLRAYDPAVLAHATRVHHDFQDSLAKLVRDAGHDPLSPAPWDPQFDIAWRCRHGLVVCEVKTGYGDTREQIRLGMGQVAEYRQVLQDRGESPVLAVLAMDCRADPLTHRVANALSLSLLQQEDLAEGLRRLM